MRTYIPLNALRAFEAAARHLSFTRAAAELCVTPTAISHQVRMLEEFLHTPLFQRKSGKLILTPAASNALQELSEGFNKLESALLALNRRGRQRKLSVAASPSVASLWLMPKLSRFFATAPDVELSLCTLTGESDFSDGPFDVAICSTDDHPGRKVDYLMEERIYPVCSPALLEDLGLTSEAALSELPLIHDDKVNEQFPTWRRFFEATQSAMRDVTCGLRFNQSSLAIEAAIRGHGLLLGRNRLIATALAERRLTILSDRPHPDPLRYYVVRQRGEERRAVRTFLDWLCAEVEAENDFWRAEGPDRSLEPGSARHGTGIVLGPDESDELTDVDWRGDRDLVGDKRRGIQRVTRRHGKAHRRSEILDIGDAAADAQLIAR
jgi:LysR family transcriptional regulator, glycine cleavage system transcriptional activator